MSDFFSRRSHLTLKQRVLQITISISAFCFSVWIIDSIQYTSFTLVLVTALAATVLASLLQPLFSILTRVVGILGILFVSFFGYAIVFWIAIVLTPAVSYNNVLGILVAAWLYAIIVTLLNWIIVSQSDDVFLNEILKHATIKKFPNDTPAGFIFIQLDGVSAPVLDAQIKAGNLPNITRLIREYDYEFHPWHTEVPSTTPASQAGILLGANDGIPAFRWYEKDTGKMVVANQTAGAHLIEQRLSTGNGLLANGGVSIGNLFSGDAPTNIMVMSKLENDKSSIRIMKDYTSYFSTPLGFMRSFILSIVEMVKEIYQARRQVSRNVTPRIKRHGTYVLLRAATNVLMRDLQTTIVIQNMMKGVNSLYVDYLDYDEVAHHAGMARPESLASLTGLDWVVGIIDKARSYAERDYEIILVSDHGQSQGPTFKQLHNGKTIESYISTYMHDSAKIHASSSPVEEQSAVRSLLGSQKSNGGLTSSSTNTIRKSFEKSYAETDDANISDIVFTGSGNLGNIWINKYKSKATYEQIYADYPRLIENLCETEGVGMLLMQSKDGPLVISKTGKLYFTSGKLQGEDPLKGYSKHDYTSLARVITMKNSPDIAIISSYNQTTGEVYAFEELVGNHGGIGGWQTEAILLHPRKFKIDKKFLVDGDIVGAESVHKILKSWLNQVQKK
jgi:predicted AlkP superfamily pyrophosphatase or phosphodiesterase/uncharacterized membrane protein YvlD (DUF360 family)